MVRDAQAFAASAGFDGAQWQPLAGDASLRRYTRLMSSKQRAMMMDCPPEYESIVPYVRIARYLHSKGYGAPEVLAAAEAEGFVLSEDLGDNLFSRALREGADEAALYRAAVDVLIAWAVHLKRDAALPLADYSRDVYRREVMLVPEWCKPDAEYVAAWDALLEQAPQGDVFVHRDYHADNLLWLPERVQPVGLLDFQDALWGHAAYDLVSLLEDARRDVPEALADAELARYIRETGVEDEEFRWAYAWLGAQRNCKIIGIFNRLAKKDDKPHYLSLLPRVWGYLRRDVQHPSLASLRVWVEKQGG